MLSLFKKKKKALKRYFRWNFTPEFPVDSTAEVCQAAFSRFPCVAAVQGTAHFWFYSVCNWFSQGIHSLIPLVSTEVFYVPSAMLEAQSNGFFLSGSLVEVQILVLKSMVV